MPAATLNLKNHQLTYIPRFWTRSLADLEAIPLKADLWQGTYLELQSYFKGPTFNSLDLFSSCQYQQLNTGYNHLSLDVNRRLAM